MNRRMLECRSRVATCVQRLHEAEGNTRVVQILCCPHLPPLGRPRKVPRRLCLLSESFQRLCIAGRKPFALPAHPLLELRRVAEKESVEKGTSVESYRSRVIRTRQRGVELGRIHPDHVGIQPQVIPLR